MRIVLFCHSLLSDWNHGNAHFLRGIVSELQGRGHDVHGFEPVDSWSRQNLQAEKGSAPFRELERVYPRLNVSLYDPDQIDLDQALDQADLVLVHEWNPPALVSALGRHRKHSAYRLLFHDTHHRSVTDPQAMSRYDLSNYDGVLAFGEAVRQVYLRAGWAKRVWTFHEAADPYVFHPWPKASDAQDLIWVGNWGDEERTEELKEFLLGPVEQLGLRARVYGVRYPAEGLQALEKARIAFGGWLANYKVPQVFAQHRLTVHVPRRPYAKALPGIPTIRVFEALACAMPLLSAPWSDEEGLFRSGDYVLVQNGEQMKTQLRHLLHDPQMANELGQRGLETVLQRHTCAHRVDALLGICEQLGMPTEKLASAQASAAFEQYGAL